MTLTLTNITKILTQCNVFYTVIAILYWDFWMELTHPGKVYSIQRNWSKSGGCHITPKSLNT